MSWLYLFLAIALEVAGTTSMKFSEGFTKLVPATLMVIFYLASLGVLSLTLKEIELGVAYAVWGGLGIALITTIGCIFFNESVNPIKIACIALIIAGVVGLNLWGSAHAAEPVDAAQTRQH